METVLPYLAPAVRERVGEAARELGCGIEEIRLRAGRPLELVTHARRAFVDACGRPVDRADAAPPLPQEEVARTFQLVCQGSVYAWEEQLRGGFVTLPGGHRVGVSGRVIVEGGRVRTVRPVGGLNVRVARQVPGAALRVLPHVLGSGGRLLSTLLLSPPGAGKTTLLRDLVRLVSAGDAARGMPAAKVTVVDERSELAGSREGVPTLDVGPRTDVLDGCPKAEGMLLAIRALSPEVVAVDEIGRAEDVVALREALRAGVTVLATAHAASVEDARRRPALRSLLVPGAFERVVVLSRRHGPGTVECVWP